MTLRSVCGVAWAQNTLLPDVLHIENYARRSFFGPQLLHLYRIFRGCITSLLAGLSQLITPAIRMARVVGTRCWTIFQFKAGPKTQSSALLSQQGPNASERDRAARRELYLDARRCDDFPREKD